MPHIATDDGWDADNYSDDDDDTVPCPHCEKEIYDGAEQCPYCGKYISEEDIPRDRRPGWIILGASVCLAIAIMWVCRG